MKHLMNQELNTICALVDLKAHNEEEMKRWEEGFEKFKNEHSDYLEWLTEREMRLYYTLEVYMPHEELRFGGCADD